jgi:hypothetical protein
MFGNIQRMGSKILVLMDYLAYNQEAFAIDK